LNCLIIITIILPIFYLFYRVQWTLRTIKQMKGKTYKSNFFENQL